MDTRYCAWGCFRYFCWSENRVGLAAAFPGDQTHRPSSLSLCSGYAGHHASPGRSRVAAPRVARKGEAWWACLDSNQEPDRYERPALTIELQAPPRAAVQD